MMLMVMLVMVHSACVYFKINEVLAHPFSPTRKLALMWTTKLISASLSCDKQNREQTYMLICQRYNFALGLSVQDSSDTMIIQTELVLKNFTFEWMGKILCTSSYV